MVIFLAGLYIACGLIANVTASKQITLAGITVPAAVFIYALTFTLVDLVNEKLGKSGARKVVYTAFAANLLLAGYTQLAIILPSAPFYQGQESFISVFGSTPRIVAASLIAKAAYNGRVAAAGQVVIAAQNRPAAIVGRVAETA